MNTVSYYDDASLKFILWVLLTHAVWWIVGVDQVVLPIISCFFLFIGVMTKRLALSTDTLAYFLAFFVLIHLVEILTVLALPDFSHYGPLYIYRTFLFISPILVFLMMQNVANEELTIYRIINSIIITVVISCVASFFAYFLFFKGVVIIPTLFSYIAPSGLDSFGILNSWFEKNIIRHTWLFSSDFYRPRGLFNFGNLFALALEVAIPLSLYMARLTKGKRYYFACLCMVITIILTTSRAGVIITLLGLGLVSILISRRKALYITFFLLYIVSAILVEESGYHFLLSPQSVITSVTSDVNNLRSDSTEARQMIYEKTLEHIQERPVLGWGTYRKIPGDPLWPYLGSHSTYLSIMYRLGLLGMVPFIMIILLLAHKANWVRRRTQNLKLWLLSNYMISIIVMISVHMTVLDIHDDIYALYIVWLALLIIPIMYNKAKNEQ